METDYKVLYRKYRPSNFDEIVGQKYAISMLKNAIINDKISHAYIFTGPRGTGKTSTAKVFAKTVNCEHLKDGNPCNSCDSCKHINENADIIEIDAASNNGVDEIRELINNVKVSPSYSKFKVYIIDEVHMLSASAFNALLLTLEEPPAHVIFILATTNIENVPITILSRCQRYDFKQISNDDIENHLKYVCEQENIEISDDALKEISYLSDGGLRDALSILNQLSTSNSSISLETVLESYGSVSMIQIKNIIQYFLDNDFTNLKSKFTELSQGAVDYKTFIKKMIDELFIKAIDYKNDLNDEKYSVLKKIIFELNDLINKININIDPFLLISMIFIENMKLNIEKSDNKEISEPKLKDMSTEDRVLNENELKENLYYNEYIDKLTSVRINNCFTNANKKYLNESKKNWQNFLSANDLINNIKSFIIDCDVVLSSENINIIIHDQQSVANLFNKELEIIENEYKKCLNLDMKFIALSKENWEFQKEAYIRNIKNGIQYIYQDEPTYEHINNQPDEAVSSLDIADIFKKEKIVIK